MTSTGSTESNGIAVTAAGDDPRLAVLASGSGTLLEALLAAELPIVTVLVDRPCRALDIAKSAGIDAVLITRDDFGSTFDRSGFTAAVVEALSPRHIERVAMAGWGTILGAAAFEAFPGRIINTHPALLPSFPGWHGVRDALAYGVKVTGCTVHIATERVDDGPILAQEAVAVLPNDDEASLHERIKVVERRIYAQTLADVLDRLRVDRSALLGGD